MRDKIARFMYGRYAQYGQDGFNKFLWVLWLALLFISAFMSRKISIYFVVLADVCIIYSLFRMMSRNIDARRKENEVYCYYKSKVTSIIGQKKNEHSQKANYRFYTCTKCGQRVRVPKGRGKIEITCPKCGNKFIKKS